MTEALPPKHVVLYADDDEDDLMLVQDAFSSYAANVEVVTARDGAEALAYLDSLSLFDPSPCLIILDINMPRVSGKEALRHIRGLERFAGVPVVLFTTSSLPLDGAFAERYRAGFITKPIDAGQMALIADRFLEHCADEIRSKIEKRLR